MSSFERQGDISFAGPFPAIPAINTEVDLWDGSKVPKLSYAPDLTLATGTYLDSTPNLQSAVVALFPTTQPVTLNVYWYVNGLWWMVDTKACPVGSQVAVGGLFVLVPFGGRATRIAYKTGATVPATLSAHLRFRTDYYNLVMP